MTQRNIILLFLGVAFTLYAQSTIAEYANTNNASSFHAPATDAEKMIAEILKLDDSSTPSLFHYLTGYPKPFANDRYATMFTQDFRNSVLSTNHEALKQNCGGKYIEGEICGLDINPVSCTQDKSDDYFFRTEQQTTHQAIISYAWPENQDASATYRLLKDAKGWKLDAVSCPRYLKFNWDNDK